MGSGFRALRLHPEVLRRLPGSTAELERHLDEHRTGYFGGYTSTHFPVELVWFADFPTEHEAFLSERQIKGWSRAKKEALIHGNWDGLRPR